MEEKDIRAPLLYVMGRDIRPEDAHYVFSLTPCMYGVVTSDKDYRVAKHYVPHMLKAEDESACHDMSLHVARLNGLPVLTIGEGKGMKAVYSNGDEEELCLSNLTSTN
jgi:hypothetical protein